MWERGLVVRRSAWNYRGVPLGCSDVPVRIGRCGLVGLLLLIAH
jgi:hypothetical protein